MSGVDTEKRRENRRLYLKNSKTGYRQRPSTKQRQALHQYVSRFFSENLRVLHVHEPDFELVAVLSEPCFYFLFTGDEDAYLRVNETQWWLYNAVGQLLCDTFSDELFTGKLMKREPDPYRPRQPREYSWWMLPTSKVKAPNRKVQWCRAQWEYWVHPKGGKKASIAILAHPQDVQRLLQRFAEYVKHVHGVVVLPEIIVPKHWAGKVV